MFIKDGIAYAGDASPALKICGVRPLADWKLWVRFNTGEAKIYDFKPMLNYPAFKPLLDEELFKQVYMELLYGTMVILILHQRSFIKMVLIQEKVHRIFLARKKKTTALAALLRRTVVLLC